MKKDKLNLILEFILNLRKFPSEELEEDLLE